MGFHVASGHGKVIQAIELHKGREYRHQHDQQEHDFGHLALHKYCRGVTESASRSDFCDCGDYSTTLINGNV